jgi:RNA polymerase sigma-70 factor, ECF subfamily
MINQPDDWVTEELILRLKNKDKNAFEELLHHFGPRLLNFGMKMCRQKEDALDIFQDTLEKAFSSLSQLKEPQAIKTWLFRVAANACLMKRRKLKSAAEEIPLEDLVPEKESLEKEASWDKFPEKAMENKELREKLKEAILSLPEIYRQVLLLRDMEGFSTEETAEILGLSKDVVKMRLLRARAKIREEMAGFFRGS